MQWDSKYEGYNNRWDSYDNRWVDKYDSKYEGKYDNRWDGKYDNRWDHEDKYEGKDHKYEGKDDRKYEGDKDHKYEGDGFKQDSKVSLAAWLRTTQREPGCDATKARNALELTPARPSAPSPRALLSRAPAVPGRAQGGVQARGEEGRLRAGRAHQGDELRPGLQQGLRPRECVC